MFHYLTTAFIPPTLIKRLKSATGKRRRADMGDVVDLRDMTTDPLEAVHQAGRRFPVIDVPIEKCRCFQHVGIPLESTGSHPFVQSLLEYESGVVQRYHGSALNRYLDRFQPGSACEALALDPDLVSDQFRSLNQNQAILPWWPSINSTSVMQIEQSIIRTARKEYAREGMTYDEVAGMYWHGPFSRRQGEVEYARLVTVYKRIKKEGFRRTSEFDGDVKGVLLVDGQGKTAFLLNSGQHRASALAALGHETIPVRLFSPNATRIVRRDDVGSWPHVRSGLFCRDVALMVFDRIFSGIPSFSASAGRTGDLGMTGRVCAP